MRDDRVLVTGSLPAGVDSEIPATWQSWVGPGVMPRAELLEAVAELDGLLCMLTDTIDVELLEAAPRLRVLSQMAVGVDNIDLEAATAAGIPVGHTPDVLTETTADTAFALLAAAVRRIPEGQARLRAGEVPEWDPEFMLGGDLFASTLGIVGLGRIGQAVARRTAGFDMEVLYSAPRPKAALEEDLGVGHVSYEELMARCDHVVLTAPLTDRTRHMVDGRALASMKDGALLVNVARGGLVDHDALVEAVAGGRISAALDVTEPEPLPPGHPLLSFPNVLVTPHLGSASVRTRAAMARRAVENLERGLAGEQLVACANPEVYSALPGVGRRAPAT